MALCNITHTFKDSAGVPVAGTFHWKLDGMLFLANGDIHLPIESLATVTSTGVLNINLEASESQGITYRFWFVPDGAVDDIPILDFNSTVPNETSAKLSELIPLQLTTDQLPSGLRRLAQIIMNDDDYSAILRLIKPEGNYDPDKFYSEGSLVTYDGGSWLYIAKTITKGNAPNIESTYWQQLGSRGLPGFGTSGNDTPYDAAGWLGALDAPTRNSLAGVFVERNQPTTTFTSELPPSNLQGNLLLPLSYLLGNFAVTDSPELLGNPTAPNKGTGDGTNSIATCKHVLDSISLHSQTNHLGNFLIDSINLGSPQTITTNNYTTLLNRSLSVNYRGLLIAFLGLSNGNNAATFEIGFWLNNSQISYASKLVSTSATDVIISITTIANQSGLVELKAKVPGQAIEVRYGSIFTLLIPT